MSRDFRSMFDQAITCAERLGEFRTREALARDPQEKGRYQKLIADYEQMVGGWRELIEMNERLYALDSQ